MKTAYIAHPLRGDVTANIQRAAEICWSVAQSGVLPLSPLHNFGYLDTDGDQFHAMQLCFSLLSLADELHVYGEWWKSEGCLAEIHYAISRNMPIKIKTVPPLGVSG